jgi:hypothetical protein
MRKQVEITILKSIKNKNKIEIIAIALQYSDINTCN